MVLGCCFGAFLDEEPCEIEMTPLGRLMERSRPTLVPGRRAGAVIDEELYEIDMAVEGR